MSHWLRTNLKRERHQNRALETRKMQPTCCISASTNWSTASAALRLAKFLGTSPDFWLNLQMHRISTLCYMFDLNEPIHVHVRRGRSQAKFWVSPIAIAWTRGYRPYELTEIERIIRENEEAIHDTWRRENEKRQ
jgi:hypothetical protein